jgi:hypothetical protein
MGVDCYQGAGINRLSSAVRDATALHALFTDSIGGSTTSLADEDATKQAIRDELAKVASVSTDRDAAVIALSGLGTPTHALVPYDADRARLDETLLPLDDLAELLNSIPAATLLCVLDCCFSGGSGASATYHELGGQYFDERDRQAVQRWLVRRLEALGYAVSLQPTIPAA